MPCAAGVDVLRAALRFQRRAEVHHAADRNLDAHAIGQRGDVRHELAHLQHRIDEAAIDLAELHREIEHRVVAAHDVREHRDARLQRIEHGIERADDLVDLIDDGLEEIADEAAEIEARVLEADVRRLDRLAELEAPIEMEIREDARDRRAAADARGEREIDHGLGFEAGADRLHRAAREELLDRHATVRVAADAGIGEIDEDRAADVAVSGVFAARAVRIDELVRGVELEEEELARRAERIRASEVSTTSKPSDNSCSTASPATSWPSTSVNSSGGAASRKKKSVTLTPKPK